VIVSQWFFSFIAKVRGNDLRVLAGSFEGLKNLAAKLMNPGSLFRL